VSRTPAVHGTDGMYRNHGCRCLPCRVAHAEYQRQWQHDSRRGRKRLLSSDDCREHLEALLASGMCMRAVEDVCGISDTALWKIVGGQTGRVQRRTYDAIMGVALGMVVPGYPVPSAKAKRLMREMRKCGVTRRHIAAALGQEGFTQLVNRRVTWKTWDRLTTMYRLLARGGHVDASVLEEVA